MRGAYGLEVPATDLRGMDDAEVLKVVRSRLERVLSTCGAAPDWETLTLERSGQVARRHGYGLEPDSHALNALDPSTLALSPCAGVLVCLRTAEPRVCSPLLAAFLLERLSVGPVRPARLVLSIACSRLS